MIAICSVGLSHHVGALLSHANLAEERQAAAELEALHRFSVFCLHDLKNLAARLSLVAQNAEHHGKDPAFQESAMRTVADTAKKITDSHEQALPEIVQAHACGDAGTNRDVAVSSMKRWRRSGERETCGSTSAVSLSRRFWPCGSKFTKCC